MSKEQEIVEYKVGLFVLVGLAVLGICIFLLGGENSLFVKYYQLRANMENVQGIQNGSVVSLAGVKVGNVTEIVFIPKENRLELKLRIEEKYSDRIRGNAVASLKTSGALGDKYVYLSPGTYDFPPLKAGETVKTEVATDLFSLTERGDQVENVFAILREMKTLMQRINGDGRSEEMMANVVTSSKTLKETLAETKSLLLDIRGNFPKNSELKTSIERLSSILEKVDEGRGTLGSLINDPTLYQSLTALLGGQSRNQYLKSLMRDSIQKHEEAGRK